MSQPYTAIGLPIASLDAADIGFGFGFGFGFGAAVPPTLARLRRLGAFRFPGLNHGLNGSAPTSISHFCRLCRPYFNTAVPGSNSNQFELFGTIASGARPVAHSSRA